MSSKTGPTEPKATQKLPGTWTERAKSAVEKVIRERTKMQMDAWHRGDTEGGIRWGAKRGFAQETLHKVHRREQRREEAKRMEAHWAAMRAKKSASSEAGRAYLAQIRAAKTAK